MDQEEEYPSEDESAEADAEWQISSYLHVRYPRCYEWEHLNPIYRGLPDEMIARCEERRERIERNAARFITNLREVRDALVPPGRFKDWCSVVGLEYSATLQTEAPEEQAEFPLDLAAEAGQASQAGESEDDDGGPDRSTGMILRAVQMALDECFRHGVGFEAIRIVVAHLGFVTIERVMERAATLADTMDLKMGMIEMDEGIDDRDKE